MFSKLVQTLQGEPLMSLHIRYPFLEFVVLWCTIPDLAQRKGL